MTSAPLLLAIDTAGPRLQLALWRQAGVEILVEDMPTGQAERIFPAIAEMLACHATSYGQIDRIAVTTGPGSFTGVRIGLSAARGLGLALGVPVVGVPTLVAISLAGGEGPLTVLLDARRDEAYLQDFEAPGRPSGPARVLPMAQAQRRAGAARQLLVAVAPDVARLAAFAATADPAAFPAAAAYIREADAKPQTRFAVARATPA